jgi:hypothetical protein
MLEEHAPGLVSSEAGREQRFDSLSKMPSMGAGATTSS